MTSSVPVRLITGPNPTTEAATLVVDQGGAHGHTVARLEPGSDSAPGLYLSPGWVDLHAHVYDAVTSLSVPADAVGLATGVHVVADAGSAGEATIDGLARYVVPASGTAIRAWINIGSHGLVHMREVADPAWMDVDRTLAAIERHRGLVCGVKVRSSGAIVGAMGLQPLDLARLVAREAQLPLMVHIGEFPPAIDDVLDRLDPGDVVTHCFHGKTGRPWATDGAPAPALRRALERGVRLDVGHGKASFSYAIAAGAINAAGTAPHSISTDVHIRNIDGPVVDLATTMTKLLACGMELHQVIGAVTDGPRLVLGDDPWIGPDGAIRHATLFRVPAEPPDGRSYLDADDTRIPVSRSIRPVAAIGGHGITVCGVPDPALAEVLAS